MFDNIESSSHRVWACAAQEAASSNSQSSSPDRLNRLEISFRISRVQVSFLQHCFVQLLVRYSTILLEK